MPDEQNVVYALLHLIISVDHGIVILWLAGRIGLCGIRCVRLDGIRVKRYLMTARLCGSVEDEPCRKQQYKQIHDAESDNQTALGTAQSAFFSAHLLFPLQFIVICVVEIRFVFRKRFFPERILILRICFIRIRIVFLIVCVRCFVLGLCMLFYPVDLCFRIVHVVQLVLLRRVHGHIVLRNVIVLLFLHGQTAFSLFLSAAGQTFLGRSAVSLCRTY